jgi:hypothetical protein
VLLLVPVVGMQVSREFAWTGSDFAAAAALLIGAGLAFEITMRSARAAKFRVPIAAGLLFAVALAWAHGAVGCSDPQLERFPPELIRVPERSRGACPSGDEGFSASLEEVSRLRSTQTEWRDQLRAKRA